ncbi:hypothetical protein [Metabacillus fastidiosus]|uniref:hypothetical protein n=1 Tax=Metabacillus fastidiosus TaxID=1458 RepID=UPI003D26A4B7
MNLRITREMYTKELYKPNFTVDLLKQLYHFIESKSVSDLNYFSDYDKAGLLCAMETIKNLKGENERYKEINDGLLKIQMDLREKEMINNQYFKAVSENVDQLKKDLKFYMNRERINKQITKELITLNDSRVDEILKKVRTTD